MDCRDRGTGSPLNFVRLAFQQVNQARVAFGYLSGKSDYFAEHFIQRQLGANDATDTMQERELGSRRLHNVKSCHITE